MIVIQFVNGFGSYLQIKKEKFSILTYLFFLLLLGPKHDIIASKGYIYISSGMPSIHLAKRSKMPLRQLFIIGTPLVQKS